MKTQLTKRILGIVLCLAMLMTYLPTVILAADGDVASVTTTEGTQTYTDLASAFAAAEQAENSVLTLLADTTISSTVYVYGGKFTVDLNGKTWTANCRALGILGADMRITDSTADGLGKIVGTTGNNTIMIGNGTKLEVAGGTVENTRDGRCIDTQYNGHPTDAQFTLSGGKLITAGWSAIHVDCTSVTIKNGEIKSQGDAYYHGDDHDYRSGLLDFSQHPDPTGIAVINYASVEIIPGDTTIKLPAGYCFYEQDANQPVTALPADMTNGYIIGKAPVCTCEEKCSTDSTNSACTLCSADIAFCTGGVQAQAKIGDTYYTTLVEAAAKVTEGDTIEVLTDVTIGADETVTFAAFTHLNVAEGKTVTCSGTVKIGEEDGIIFENTLYYYGGDRTYEEWQDFQTILQLTCWTAGEGHVTYDPETNTLSLYNATSTFCPNSASNGCLEYAQESASEPMTINFRGVSTLTSENKQVFWIETPVTMNGIGPNAVLNVIGLNTDLNEPCCRFQSSLTVNSGTVNVRANFALNCTELTVASGAELNAAGGYDASGIYFVLSTGKITGDGTVNALVLDGSATNETTQLPYVVYGNAALENDLLLHDPNAGTEAAGNFRFAFIVPLNSKLTVNEGVTLDLSTVALENIDFTGTVINNGTILLPADFALHSAPKSGNIKIGENSYAWDTENNKWIHSAGTNHLIDSATGKCGCGLEMAAAHISADGTATYYETLAEALQNTQNAATLRLYQDGSVKYMTVPGSMTLDLNGCTLTADYFTVYGTVVDGEMGGNGLVIATKGIHVASNNPYLPIYDTTASGYRFYQYRLQNLGYKTVDANTLKIGFRLVLSNPAGYNVLSNTADPKLDLVAQIHWTGSLGTTKYTFSTATLHNYAGQVYTDVTQTGTTNKAIILTIKGLDVLGQGAELTAQPIVNCLPGTVASGEAITWTVP